MIVEKIRSINGACFIRQEIDRDVNNGRMTVYSLPAAVAQGIPARFKYIYKLEYAVVNQLDGMMVVPNNDIALMLHSGKVQVYLIDLRKDSGTYLNQIDLPVSRSVNFQQVYVPYNVAWGVINLEESSSLHIASGNPLSRDDLYIVDPFDSDMNLQITLSDFSVRKYERIYSLAEISKILYPEERQNKTLHGEAEYQEEAAHEKERE